jgi:hypothetical protein
MDLSAFNWNIDNPTFNQFGYSFLGTVIPVSPEMVHVMTQPMSPPVSRVVLYVPSCEDLPVLDRLDVPKDLIPLKSLSPGDIFTALAAYYNTPLDLTELQRLSNLGSVKARANLGTSGTLILDPSMARRHLMGSRLRFRGLIQYRDGFLVRIE